ncbi:Epoxyqueuosine reductase [Candidatus Hepatincolaceae symbiont of Richtersius coronifer]
MNNALNIKQCISDYAKIDLGISSIGFTEPVIPDADLQNYLSYLAQDNYGEMQWMETRKELRSNPKLLFPEAKTAILVGVNYYHQSLSTNDCKISSTNTSDYKISLYAHQREDYHRWVYKRVKLLAKFMAEKFTAQSRYFVDSAPILEKVLAKQTKIGWQGKHTCIVSQEFGSWLFLGVILTELELPKDAPHRNLCGTCNKCIVACPTGALTPYKLEVKKCISYLTIEHKSAIEELLQVPIDNKIFGCDDCLSVCPFNKWQKNSLIPETQNNPLYPGNLKEFLQLQETKFLEIFKFTPLKRTGYLVILRNILIAAKNSQNKELIPYILPYIQYNDVNIKELAHKAINSLALY